MGLLMSIVLNELLKKSLKPEGKRAISEISKVLAYLIILVLLSINIFNYFSTLQSRDYKIRDTNRYLAKTIEPGDTALGAWAPSLTWDCKARAIPVWNNFLNFKDPIGNYNPRIIISEIDEQDSEQAYKSQGIHLDELSDSTKTIKIGQWEVCIYYLNPF